MERGRELERQTEQKALQTDRKEMRWGSDGIPPGAEGKVRVLKRGREIGEER